MDFDPEIYDNSNNDTLIPAKRLIKIISELKPNNNKFSLILDIGCGSGNMTKLLADEIECDHIIGCDIDQKMIEYAKRENKKSNIDYLVQDIQRDWLDFNTELKDLKGKVSVITSNFALTWIHDIKTTAENLSHLISDDGLLVLNIVYDGDIYDRLEPNERLLAEKCLKYPTEEEMIGKWITCLKKSGFKQIDITYWEPKSIFNEKLYFEEYLNIPMNWYKSYAKHSNGITMEMNELLKRLLIEDRCKPLNVNYSDGQNMIEVTNYIWQIIATKC
ncbi:trans-aconitate 2-methyltransferase-like [Oppia nitens]|uniref:trans-aconitate 2-methyltransferase-like n=1 Tax=Oppia nitens TaxID=1686743 RepID=UPI0023DA829C|nr:trans-aconitate 2-methyltransferase-like [Oppia nitens]